MTRDYTRSSNPLQASPKFHQAIGGHTTCFKFPEDPQVLGHTRVILIEARARSVNPVHEPPLPRPLGEGLYCEAGDFFVDPWRPVDRAVITHAHADHACWGCRRDLTAGDGQHVLRARMVRDAMIESVAYGLLDSRRREAGGVEQVVDAAGIDEAIEGLEVGRIQVGPGPVAYVLKTF